MSEASYDRQHLAVHAAGFISSDGSTATAFGCTMARNGTGAYSMVLGESAGVVSDESFIQVQPKSATFAQAVVTNNSLTSTRVKTFEIFNNAGSNIDVDVEVVLFKSVTR